MCCWASTGLSVLLHLVKAAKGHLDLLEPNNTETSAALATKPSDQQIPGHGEEHEAEAG